MGFTGLDPQSCTSSKPYSFSIYQYLQYFSIFSQFNLAFHSLDHHSFFNYFILIRLICFSVKFWLIWHIGLFNYCTCGHYGQDGIVWLSVGSITWSLVHLIHYLFYSFISSLESALSDWHCHCLIGKQFVILIYAVFHLDVCLWSSDNWVSFNTKLNCQMDLIKPLFFD